jgi:bacteriocin biosynthesis cyclodehydratase domain-containing protein
MPDSSIRYRLRKELALIPMATGVQLRAGDDEIVVLESSEPSLLLQLLQQCQIEIDNDQLIGLCNDPELVSDLTEELHSANLIEPTNDCQNEVDRYLRPFSSHPDVSKPSGTVVVASPELGALARVVDSCLAAHGLRVVTATEPIDVEPSVPIICVWEQPHLSWVQKWNTYAIKQSQACLFVDVSHGRHATIGPFYFPNESACYECFRSRLRENTASLEELDAAHQHMLSTGEPLPKVAALPAFLFQVAGVAVAEVFASLSRHRPMESLNRAITVSFEEQTMWSEPAWRIPWCKACSE